METSTTTLPQNLQTTLQTARKSKRLSQLELALRMGVSQRHVSFVESGRSQPSRELLLSWLHELQAPLALRNVALQQAGFAPVYRGSELADAVLAPVREALGQLLQAHDPMPAMVMDAAWNVLQMNRGAQWLATTLMPWVADLPHGQPINMIDAMLHPEGMTKHISNLEEVAPALLAHMRDGPRNPAPRRAVGASDAAAPGQAGARVLAAPNGTGAHHPFCHPIRRAGLLQHVLDVRHTARHHTGITACGACVSCG